MDKIVKGNERQRLPKNCTETKNKYNDYRYSYGCVDVNKSDSSFLQIGTWVIPEDGTLEEQIRVFKRKFKVFVNIVSPIYFEGLEFDIIRVLDYPETNKNETKKKFTYCNIEIAYLFKQKIEPKSDEFKFINQKLCESLIDWIMMYDSGLVFNPVAYK